MLRAARCRVADCPEWLRGSLGRQLRPKAEAAALVETQPLVEPLSKAARLDEAETPCTEEPQQARGVRSLAEPQVRAAQLQHPERQRARVARWLGAAVRQREARHRAPVRAYPARMVVPATYPAVPTHANAPRVRAMMGPPVNTTSTIAPPRRAGTAELASTRSMPTNATAPADTSARNAKPRIFNGLA
jgi:hypothetical protein